MALKFLRAWGCDVTTFTTSDSKREEALQLGAHRTLNSRNAEELAQAASSFDFILNTTNANLDWNTCIAALKPKGRLHTVGAHPPPTSCCSSAVGTGSRPPRSSSPCRRQTKPSITSAPAKPVTASC